MKNITQHTGELKIITRLPSSYFGNPRFLISVDGFTCKTKVDSKHGYSVQNYEGKKVTVSIGSHYGSATLNTINTAKGH